MPLAYPSPLASPKVISVTLSQNKGITNEALCYSQPNSQYLDVTSFSMNVCNGLNVSPQTHVSDSEHQLVILF